MMTLFLHPASPNCMAVLMAAAHLGISLDRRIIDLMSGAQQAPDYLAINPNGKVPALQDRDFVLWETVPILQYLAGRDGDTPLWPRDERRRADIARWQCWSLAHWTPALQPFVFENLFRRLKGLGDPDMDRISAARVTLSSCGAVLDKHLEDRHWAAGEVLTLADISLSAYLMYAKPALIPLADFPQILRWFERIQALPSWQLAQPAATA